MVNKIKQVSSAQSHKALKGVQRQDRQLGNKEEGKPMGEEVTHSQNIEKCYKIRGRGKHMFTEDRGLL